MRTRSLTLLCAVVVALSACAEQDPAPTDDGTYTAYNMFTGAPRFAIFKADPERDLCVRALFLWASDSGTADLATAEAVSVTHHAADCQPSEGGGPPSLEPEGVAATSATGTVT